MNKVPLPNDRGVVNLNDPLLFVDKEIDVNDVNRFRAYLRRTTSMLNRFFSLHGLPFHAQIDRAERILADQKELDNDPLLRAVQLYKVTKRKGKAHDNQVQTAVKVLREYLFSTKNINLVGAMQSGKTITTQFCGLLIPLCVYLVNHQTVHPFFLIPRDKKLARQTEDNIRRFWKLHAPLTIVHTETNEEISVISFLQKHLQQDTTHWDDRIIRISTPQMGEFHTKVEYVRNRGHRVLLLIDECHFGTQTNGLLDRLLHIPSVAGPVNIPNGEFSVSMRNEVNHGSELTRCIGVSATPFELNLHPNFAMTLQVLPVGYCGPHGWQGGLYDAEPGFKPKRPDFISYADYFKVSEASMCWQSYKSIENFLKLQHGIKTAQVSREAQLPERQKQYKKFQKTFEDNIAKMIVNCLYENNVKKGTGFCIRCSNKNYVGGADDLIQAIERRKLLGQFSNIKMIQMFDNDTDQDVEEKYEETTKDGSKVVMFFTAGARMGCSFPSDVTYWLDLTKRYSNHQAQLQGFVGRACGVGKDTMVFMSQFNVESVTDYFDSLGMTSQRAGARTEKIAGRGVTFNFSRDTFRQANSRFLKKDDLDYFCGVIDNIENFLSKEEKLPDKQISGRGKSTEIWEILAPALKRLETVPAEAFGLIGMQVLQYEPNEKQREKHRKVIGSPYVTEHQVKLKNPITGKREPTVRRKPYGTTIGRRTQTIDEFQTAWEKRNVTNRNLTFRTERPGADEVFAQLFYDPKKSKVHAIAIVMREALRPIDVATNRSIWWTENLGETETDLEAGDE